MHIAQHLTTVYAGHRTQLASAMAFSTEPEKDKQLICEAPFFIFMRLCALNIVFLGGHIPIFVGNIYITSASCTIC